MQRTIVLARLALLLPLFFAAASAKAHPEQFVCTGTLSSGSGMAGSSLEKSGRATCFFEADTYAEQRAQKICRQNQPCEVVAMTRIDGDKRIIEQVLSINGVRQPAGALHAQKDDAAVNGQARAEALDCPGKTFETFVEKFANSISLQATFTRWPLQSTAIDAKAEPEPKPVTKQLTQRQVTYPLMTALDRAKREGKIIRIAKDEDSGGQIEIAGSNSGEKVRYLFKRSGMCWKLTAIDDQSI